MKFSSPQDRHGMECSNRSSHGRLKQLCSKYSIKQKETDKLILTFFIRVPTQFTFYYKYRNKREIKIVFSFIKILSNTHFFYIVLNCNIDLPDEKVEIILNFPTLLILIVKSNLRWFTNEKS